MNKKTVIQDILLLLIICTVFSFTRCGNYKPAFDGVGLEKNADLSKMNLQKERLDELTKYIQENHQTTGMMILQDDKIVYEYGNISEVSYIASCRKSVLSILYGKYVENGTIDLRENLANLEIEEEDGLLPQEKEATINDIITSRSGVFHIPANGGYDKNNILERGSVKHGDYFVYNNWDFNVAGHILEQKTGRTVYEELESQLAIPLGFEDWNIKNQKKKYNNKKSKYPAYHMYLSTRDMAKIGQLMLNKGKWKGKQLISEEWIQKITSTVTPKDVVNERYGRNDSSDIQSSYGYMWWIMEHFKGNTDFEGAYYASGFGGQYITVIPKLNMVIVHKTKLKTLVRWGMKNGGVPDYAYWKIVHKLLTNKKDIFDLLEEENIDELINLIKSDTPNTSEYDISENEINQLGYQFLTDNELDKALRIFKLNTELYPNAFNTFDSYGECLMKLGQKDEAIKAYEKSLLLNSDNENARKVIEELNLE